MIGDSSVAAIFVEDGSIDPDFYGVMFAVSAPGAVGPKDVVVTTPKAASKLAGGFTYVPNWATLLEFAPDPAMVTDATLRSAIVATGLPWRVRDTSSQVEMLLVPPGTYSMGCSASSGANCNVDESPVHTVTITSAFYLGRYEVTQGQWTARMGSNPSFFQSATPEVPAGQVSQRPVEQVPWNAVQIYLSLTSLRLPTEAEWELAYRAGTTTAFHALPGFANGTNDESQTGSLGWTQANSAAQTRPVGGKSANGLGFHDMSGNVREWVNDRYSATYYASSPPSDPPGPATGTSRVLRGGSWDVVVGQARSSARGQTTPTTAFKSFGFRVARTP